MVAARDDGLPAAGGAEASQKGIVKSGRFVGRHDLVKNIASHKQAVDVLTGDEIREPAEERFVFPVSRGIVKGCAEVPVGSVQELHDDSVEKGQACIYQENAARKKQSQGKAAEGKRIRAGRGTHFSA